MSYTPKRSDFERVEVFLWTRHRMEHALSKDTMFPILVGIDGHRMKFDRDPANGNVVAETGWVVEEGFK